MSEIHRNLIIKKLTQKNIEFKHFEHEAVTTSEDASRIRGVALSSGAKALVLEQKKTKEMILVVVPAHKKIDFKKLKEKSGEDYSFAEKVSEKVACVPGSVPPFGSVLNLQTYADESLEDILNFNCGLLTESIQLKKSDYLVAENPIIGNFSKE
jgi:prolyl-tRNA editing enzyme YbaK/EbsC (Cys-tRNA(Pro) deacylase)